MQSYSQKIYADITRLHEQEEQIPTIAAARGLGIKIRRVDQPSGSRPVPFKPCFFLPPKTNKPKSSHRCAKRVSCVAGSSPSGSSSTLPIHPSSPHSSYSSSSLRRSSFSSSPSSSASESRSDNGEHEAIYPYMLQSLAEVKGLPLQPMPKTARQAVLTANGPIMKGKGRQDPTLELHQDDKWTVTQVFEDTTYTHPHAIVEIIVNSHGSTDEFFLTASEVRAILRVLKLRMGMSQYKHHACLPVLALSYIVDRNGDDTEYRWGSILQAHHDGRQLVIQYSPRLDFSNAQMAPASFDKFLRYYFSEPVKTDALNGKQNEGDPGWLLQTWSALRKRPRTD